MLAYYIAVDEVSTAPHRAIVPFTFVSQTSVGIAQQEPLPSGRNRKRGPVPTVLIVPTFTKICRWFAAWC